MMNIKGERREARRLSRRKFVSDNRKSVRHMWDRSLERSKTLEEKRGINGQTSVQGSGKFKKRK